MASNDQVVLGGRALDEALKTLAPKIEKNIMRAALRAGVNVIKNEAKQEVPVKTGALRKSLKVSTKSKDGKVTAVLKADSRIAPHAHLVEFGTRPHKIKPRNGDALVIGGHVVADVDHPGSRPKPFLRPSFDSKAPQAIEAVASKIRERLTKEGINVPASEPID
jgi:HK97 gp10 family phage protein